jgi:hypothetical protein
MDIDTQPGEEAYNAFKDKIEGEPIKGKFELETPEQEPQTQPRTQSQPQP